MITKKNYIFTIGYQDDTAIIDGALMKKYGNCGSKELAEAGLFKAAVCSALYDNNEQELEEILSIYKRDKDFLVSSVSHLKRTFGVPSVPEGINKVLIV